MIDKSINTRRAVKRVVIDVMYATLHTTRCDAAINTHYIQLYAVARVTTNGRKNCAANVTTYTCGIGSGPTRDLVPLVPVSIPSPELRRPVVDLLLHKHPGRDEGLQNLD